MPRLAVFLTIALIFLTVTVTFAQTKPDKDYLVYVLSESADKVSLIRFGPNGARVDHDLQTGDLPMDIDGPHGIVISPDRQFYYVSIAHGRPFGPGTVEIVDLKALKTVATVDVGEEAAGLDFYKIETPPKR